MEGLFCSCDKIICLIQGNDIVIKCRHCKRVILIRTKGIIYQADNRTVWQNSDAGNK